MDRIIQSVAADCSVMGIESEANVLNSAQWYLQIFKQFFSSLHPEPIEHVIEGRSMAIAFSLWIDRVS